MCPILPPKKKGQDTLTAKVACPVFYFTIKKGQDTFSAKVACPVFYFAIRFTIFSLQSIWEFVKPPNRNYDSIVKGIFMRLKDDFQGFSLNG